MEPLGALAPAQMRPLLLAMNSLQMISPSPTPFSPLVPAVEIPSCGLKIFLMVSLLMPVPKSLIEVMAFPSLVSASTFTELFSWLNLMALLTRFLMTISNCLPVPKHLWAHGSVGQSFSLWPMNPGTQKPCSPMYARAPCIC
jgi:hypothetical protein